MIFLPQTEQIILLNRSLLHRMIFTLVSKLIKVCETCYTSRSLAASIYCLFTKFKYKSFQGYLQQKLWCTDRFCKHLWLIRSLLPLPHSLLRPIHFWLQDLCEHTSKKKRRFNFSLTLFKTSTPFRAYHLVSSSSS